MGLRRFRLSFTGWDCVQPPEKVKGETSTFCLFAASATTLDCFLRPLFQLFMESRTERIGNHQLRHDNHPTGGLPTCSIAGRQDVSRTKSLISDWWQAYHLKENKPISVSSSAVVADFPVVSPVIDISSVLCPGSRVFYPETCQAVFGFPGQSKRLPIRRAMR